MSITKEEIEELVWDAKLAVAKKRAFLADHALIALHARNVELEARLGAAEETLKDTPQRVASSLIENRYHWDCSGTQGGHQQGEWERDSIAGLIKEDIDSILVERAARKEGVHD